MAYYMRSNNASSYGNYMMSNSSMQGGYLMHSAKGSEWKKPHKYIDKRWIDGAWKYLYELPKNIQETAKKAGEAVKDTAEKASKAAKDFKDYSKNVDKREARATAEVSKAEKRANESNSKAQAEWKKQEQAERQGKTAASLAESSQKEYKTEKARLDSELRKAEASDKALMDRIRNGGVVNQSEFKASKDRINSIKDQQKELEQKQRTQQEQLKNAGNAAVKDINDSKAREAAYKAKQDEQEQRRKDMQEEQRKAAEEQKTMAYKASKALNDIIDGADNISAQGAQWLKNQLESGNKWAMNTLAAIEEKGTSAVVTGNAFLKKLLGKNKQQPSRSSSSSSSSSGRNYSGTGNKAQRRETVAGGPVSDNDYRRRPKR